MLVGHVAVAFIAKGLQPRVSLGTAVVATLVSDVLLFALVLAGIEHVNFRTSAIPGVYFTGSGIALSHSLAMSLVWGVAVAVIALLIGRRRDSHLAALLVAIVVSHWLLDVISRGPFIPVMVIEGAIWAGAILLYVARSRSVDSAGRYVFWGGVASWTYVWYYNAFLPPRIRPEEAPIEAVILLFLIIAWAHWMNRARVMKSAS